MADVTFPEDLIPKDPLRSTALRVRLYRLLAGNSTLSIRYRDVGVILTTVRDMVVYGDDAHEDDVQKVHFRWRTRIDGIGTLMVFRDRHLCQVDWDRGGAHAVVFDVWQAMRTEFRNRANKAGLWSTFP